MAKQKSTLSDRISKLTSAIDPEKGKTEVTIEDVTRKKSGFLEDLRTPPPKSTSHKSIKLKAELYEDLKRIAEAEGIDSYGKLLSAILEDWISKYNSGQV